MRWPPRWASSCAARCTRPGQPCDRGQQALIGRFRRLPPATCPISAELPFPNLGDPHTWDLVVRLPGQLVGVECETRIRDIQAIARRMHRRERDGGVDVVLLALGRSVHNRRHVDELRASLGPVFQHSPRLVLDALRHGRPVPGSAVILL